jgi:lipoprotein-anchoring transpeptidase ErfK/SrfK
VSESYQQPEKIGKPTSLGCTHLADADLIPFYNLLPSGTLVRVAEK